MENTIVLVSDPLFTEGHRTPPGHPERPERITAAESAFSGAALTMARVPLPPRDATDDELARVHTGAYIEALTRAQGRRGYLDADTYCSEGSVQAARRAAGGAVALVDALVDGKCRAALALVRPPGHHARPGAAMGFCLLNNVAVAAAQARARGCKRVAIVDFDVHHGNGTEETFDADPSVLYVSLHQWPYYPGTGAAESAGSGEGLGATVNVPLSAGAGDAAYVAAFDRIVCPVLSNFAPELLLVSAGFDAHVQDPLAAMRLTEAGYAAMTARLAGVMPERGAGRIGLVLEGGYGLPGLESSLRATLEALDGGAAPEIPGNPTPAEEADLERALRSARRFHPLGA